MTRDYLALRPENTPVDRSLLEPSLTDFTRSGWAYFPVKDLNQLALAINRALGDVRLPAMPEVPDLQTIGFCNLRCPYCPTHGTDEDHAIYQAKSWTMSDDLIRKIAHDAFPYARQISLSAAGENLLARNTEIAAEQAHAYGCNLFINTNGTVIAKKRLRHLWGATHLRVSLDGATPATFEALRLGAQFGKVMRNVRVLTRAGELLPRPLRLQMAINFCFLASNLRDLPLMVDLARFLGISRINGIAVETTRPSLADEPYAKYPGAYRYHLDRMNQRAAELGIRIAMPTPTYAAPDPTERPTGTRLALPYLDDAYYAGLPPIESLVDLADLDEEALDLAEDAVATALERMQGPLNQEAGEAVKRAVDLRARQMDDLGRAYASLTPAEHARLGRLKDSDALVKDCSYLHRFLYFYPDGGLRPCCYEFVPEIGTLKDGSIRDAFNGAKLATLARRFVGDDPDPSCAGCPKWNRVPEQAIFPLDPSRRDKVPAD